MQLLAIDITGEYGHFKKFNTTTSPLTYSIPTAGAIKGMLGAVLGIERENSNGAVPEGKRALHEIFTAKNFSYAVEVINPIKKTHVAFNHLDTGKSAKTFSVITNRTQIEFELLKNAAFRVYISFDDVLKTELIERLKAKRHHFTPYLGLAQCTAHLDYMGEIDALPVSGEIEVNSAINLSKLSAHHLDFGQLNHQDRQLAIDTFPMVMNAAREVEHFAEIMTETTGASITLNNAPDVFQIPNQKAIMLL